MAKAAAARNIVLYAEDDNDDIEFVKYAFSQHTHNVELVTVPDGLEALSYLKNLSQNDPYPCLIILDINMPKMDGKEALIKLRSLKRFNDIPAILFTTSTQKRDLDFAAKYNAGFITKPIDNAQMDMIAAKFIDHCTGEAKKEMQKHVS